LLGCVPVFWRKGLPPSSALKMEAEDQTTIANRLFVYRTVTSELTFYLETLKTLHALPVDELTDKSMDDIWLST
jgi:hypothetical protein